MHSTNSNNISSIDTGCIDTRVGVATAGHRGRRARRVAIGATALAIVAAACGSSDDATPVADAQPAAPIASTAPPIASTAAPAEPVVDTPAATIGTTDLGDLLVGERGLTLYGFTNDVDATSACYGTCAEAWPPVIVDAAWTVAPGLDSGIFNATIRDDGQLQLVAGKWPLYYFAGDATAGDVNGQGSGDVWFAVGTDGLLVEGDSASDDAEAAEADGADGESEAAAPEVAAPEVAVPPVATATSDLGDTLVDDGGLTVYGFTDDADGVPTCDGACADAWPPVLVDGATLPAGLDADVFSVVTRNDGTSQLKAGAWPLYSFAGDAAPGDVNGQGSGDVWFVVDPQGGLITGDAQAAASGNGDASSDDDGY